MTPREYLSSFRDFLMTYPRPTPYAEIAIDYQDVDPRGSARSGEGNALRFNGRLIISDRKNVLGEGTRRERINMALVMWRSTNDNENRRDIINFINDLVDWFNQENDKRGTINENPLLPHFSDTDYEIIVADGGGQTAAISQDESEFQVAFHADFETLY